MCSLFVNPAGEPTFWCGGRHAGVTGGFHSSTEPGWECFHYIFVNFPFVVNLTFTAVNLSARNFVTVSSGQSTI